MSTPNKTAIWRQNGERFEFWQVGDVIRYRRPGEIGFKSMPPNMFWRTFMPEPEPEVEIKPQAVQGGLFS